MPVSSLTKSPADFEKQMIYSVFVRNHTPEGTFQALEKDLDRIQSLGTDIIWLMPIHPVGKKERKGKDGSPYANQNYRIVNPEMGTIEDFQHLVDEIHKRGMKVIIDVVYNHTSPDSDLYQKHPEWFYKDENGKPYSLVKDWSDIIDLDYSSQDLREELLSTLEYWSGIVDGYRCDVASRVPLEFWKEARKRTSKINPDLFWLAESTHLPFTKFVRDNNRPAVCDAQLYEAFDVLYDYDVFPFMEDYLNGKRPLSRWMEELERQEAVFPADFIKLRNLENHDNPRIMEGLKKVAQSDEELEALWQNWTALMFFLKGMPMVYHGQEFMADHRPSIFDQDVVEQKTGDTKLDHSAWITKLSDLHKTLPSHAPVSYAAVDKDDLVLVCRNGQTGLFLLKNIGPMNQMIPVPVPDGERLNEFSGQMITVRDGKLPASAFPVLVNGNWIPNER